MISVVNLDMPILTYDFQDVIAFGAEHSTHGADRRPGGGADGRRGSRPIRCPSEGLFTRSDHYRFVREGVPSVFLMTGFAGEGAAAVHRLPRHATITAASDDLACRSTGRPARGSRSSNYLIAREIADGDEAPLWYADSFFGDAFGGSQRRAQRPAAIGQAASR